MEDYIKETLIASPYPFWLTVLIFALVTGLVQYLVFYFKEKGKNFATKEDITEITNKIESVKDYYSKSLEQYKIELQKKFTTDRLLIELCNNIDEQLITLLIKCKDDIQNDLDDFKDNRNVNANMKSIYALGNFIRNYGARYNGISQANNLLTLHSDLNRLITNSRQLNSFDTNSYILSIREFQLNVNSLLDIILPKFHT